MEEQWNNVAHGNKETKREFLHFIETPSAFPSLSQLPCHLHFLKIHSGTLVADCIEIEIRLLRLLGFEIAVDGHTHLKKMYIK